MSQTIRRRLTALLGACMLMPALLSTVSSSPAAQAADPQPWPVAWDLNKNNDVEELSRLYDTNEDGIIDTNSDAATRLPEILNPQQFSLHVKACAAPKGFTSIDWQLTRLTGGDPLPVYTATECETDIPLPDKPYPDALQYDLTARVHYPATPDQVVTTRVHVQDIFMVGLGDSYGSGEGNPVHVDGWFNGESPEWDNTRCHRSRLSGQEQAARALDEIDGINVTFLHLACSGALAAEGILLPYQGLVPRNPPLPPQITQANEYVQYSAGADGQVRWPDVVVTSIGGNDAGFSTVVKDCLKPSWIPVPIPIFPYAVPVDIPECYEKGASGTTVFPEGLKKLPDLYGQINQAVHGTNPSLPPLCNPDDTCKFLITEYPDGATDENGDLCSVGGFTSDEFKWVRDTMVPELDGLIREQAQAYDWVYVNDIVSNFDRHGICADGDYFRDIWESIELQNGIDGAFHPNADGHLFGYAPAIAESARYALGFPYSFDTLPRPLYAGNGQPAACDTTNGDGKLESFVPGPASNYAGLDLPSSIATQLANGSLPRGMAGANTCSASTSARVPLGTPVRELRTGLPGCPDDPRPCVGTSAGSTLLRFPVWGDEEPAIIVRSESDVARSAGEIGDDIHRHGSANAQGTTAFLATPFNGSATVSGEIVVDLTAVVQAAGANAYSLSSLDVYVNNVTNVPDCSSGDTECYPDTTTEIGTVRLELQRGTCEESASYSHGCESTFGYARSHTDSISLRAWAGSTTIADERGESTGPQSNASGTVLPVSGGLRTPSRIVRIPYSVPAGSVVTIQVSSGAYTTASEGCVYDVNDLPCTAQARSAGRITFDADIATGALLPLSGFSTPVSDTTAPMVAAAVTGPAGNNGWYVGTAHVGITATDASGVDTISYTVDGGAAVNAPGTSVDVPVGANGTHTVTYWATDVKGNVADKQSVTVKVDATAPVITLGIADGAEYQVGANAPSGVQCSDPLSGIATCDGPTTLDTTTVGAHTATFTATDAAGNSTTATLNYSVLAPPPPPATTDAITLSIPEIGFTVNGNVVSGGFTITRDAKGQPVAVTGTAVVKTSAGTDTTVSVVVAKLLGTWVGATTVSDPAKGVNVTGTTLSKTSVSAVGSNAVTGTFSNKKPARTITWTITDRA